MSARAWHLLRLEHLAHPALAELPEQSVVADFLLCLDAVGQFAQPGLGRQTNTPHVVESEQLFDLCPQLGVVSTLVIEELTTILGREHGRLDKDLPGSLESVRTHMPCP
jgi:hypothetical protein